MLLQLWFTSAQNHNNCVRCMKRTQTEGTEFRFLIIQPFLCGNSCLVPPTCTAHFCRVQLTATDQVPGSLGRLQTFPQLTLGGFPVPGLCLPSARRQGSTAISPPPPWATASWLLFGCYLPPVGRQPVFLITVSTCPAAPVLFSKALTLACKFPAGWRLRL